MKAPSFPADLLQPAGLLLGAFALRALGLDLIGSLAGYAVMLYTPLWAESRGKLTLAELGLGPGWERPAFTGAATALILCSLLAAAWHLMGGWFPWIGRLADPDFSRLLSSGAIGLVLLYPAAEELFFRGYIQKRLTDAGNDPASVIVLQAGLFAVTHLVSHLNPAALLTFFPGLVMGLLRRRERHLGAPFVFHALANAFVIVW